MPDLIARLEEYIRDELSDSKYYATLAQSAPDEIQKKLLLEFSADEKKHAQRFARAIELMTGRMYPLPNVPTPSIPSSYVLALQQRVINESADYRKYGDEYLATPSQNIKNLFYRARTDENVHALRILDILSMNK